MSDKKVSPKKIAQIVIPLLMALTVFGIWFVQEQSKVPLDEGFFALHVSEIDMEELKNANLPIIIDFGATECIPCKEMAPVLEKVNEEMENKAIIKFVDVWENPTGASGYPVQTIPTQVLINADGTPYMPSQDLGIAFKLYEDNETNEHVFTTHEGGLTEEQMNLILEDMGVK